MNENMKNEKKQKSIIVFIIIILLFLWICLLYHSGYIKLTVDIAQKEETIYTEDENKKNENTNNSETSITENTNDEKYNWGPYDINYHTNINAGNTSSNHYINTTTNTNKANVNENITKEDVEKLKFMQGKDEFKTLDNLDMFKNFEYEETKLIYPGLNGHYYFQVENTSDKDMEYILSVIETNPRNVNMQYALKRNGLFIAGNDNEYTNISELQKTNLWIASGKGDNYILYWKWVDTEQDALSSNPIERGEYTLTIKGEV